MHSLRTVLKDFKIIRPRFEVKQEIALQWLGACHAQAEEYKRQSVGARTEELTSYVRLFQRFGCNPERIGKRGTELSDVKQTNLKEMEIFSPTAFSDENMSRGFPGLSITGRNRFFEKVVNTRVKELFEQDLEAPPHLIHVSCTGYVSPSPPQTLVQSRGWNRQTSITHAYHMGCYASLPAVRIANGFVNSGATRVEILHNELCTLHLDLTDHSPEQLVVQSLFADGHIRYTAVEGDSSDRGLEVFTIREEILPDTLDQMTWAPWEWGMRMTLSRNVPQQISEVVRGFVDRMLNTADLPSSDSLPELIFAIHPGGPRIIDQIQTELKLRDNQVVHSKSTLFNYGNMSSATLPHIWKALLEDDSIPNGQWIVSLAFGPGLTTFGSVMRKRC